MMLKKIKNKTVKIAVIGMGYVGLPLAVEFGKKFDTLGFDIKTARLEELRQGCDSSLETSNDDLASAVNLRFSSSPDDLRGRDIYIVTVPSGSHTFAGGK